MKKIIIVRHAKAQKDVPGIVDFDRELTSVGMEDAEKAGDVLLKNLEETPYFIASPASRTKQTAIIIARKFGLNEDKIHFEPDIYNAYPDTLVELVRHLPETAQCVLIVGHNPGVYQLACRLAAYELEVFPTAAIAGLSFDVKTWTEVINSSGDLFLLEYPHYS